jgi:hypothetical protein
MWEFHSFEAGRKQRWSWNHHHHGKLRQESGRRFDSLAEAIMDAGCHGFEAHVDRWTVCAAESCYRQGARPVLSATARRLPPHDLQVKSHK